ncbi:peptide deformylase [Patescibacteria group bacterium]|nr:peptide deformylase [Patescibacteria group bacterium]
MFEIIEYPNKLLRKKSGNIKQISSKEVQQFIPELIETMIKKDGLGLAAPQVGKNINIIAVRMDSGSHVFINPAILWKNWFKKNVIEEGCLSFPGIFGLIKRPRTIWIKYYQPDGKLKIVKLSGLSSVIFQHEIDHLRGILFIDKIFKYIKGEDIIKELKQNAGKE